PAFQNLSSPDKSETLANQTERDLSPRNQPLFHGKNPFAERMHWYREPQIKIRITITIMITSSPLEVRPYRTCGRAELNNRYETDIWIIALSGRHGRAVVRGASLRRTSASGIGPRVRDRKSTRLN